MLKLKHTKMIFLSGIILFLIGAMLLRLGLNFTVSHAKDPLAETSLIFQPFLLLTGTKEVLATAIIALALVIGYAKGKYVISKSANRGAKRILSLPNPCPIYRIYGKSYYILMAVMMGIGVLMNILNMPKDIRGFIDAAIGAALIQGSLVYFKIALSSSKAKS